MVLNFEISDKEYMRQLLELDERIHREVRLLGYDVSYLREDFGLILIEQGGEMDYKFIEVLENDYETIDIYKHKNLECCKKMTKFDVRDNYIEIKNSKKLKDKVSGAKICIYLLVDGGIRIIL